MSPLTSPSTPASSQPTSPQILQGSLICYRLFDLGDEILLDQAEGRLAGGEGPRRVRLSRTGTQALSLTVPPLDVDLGSRTLALPRWAPTPAQVSARLFDYGCVSVRFELAIPPGTTLADMIPLCAELHDLPLLEREARQALEGVLPRIQDAVVGGPMWADLETYTLVYVQDLEGQPTGEEVLERWGQDICKLLQAEVSPQPLAEREVQEMRRNAHSYLEQDLVVVDWGSALVIEPSGSRDIPDVLELACAHLTGLRSYDDHLDREMVRIYDQVEQAARPKLSWDRYGRLASQVQERWLDLTEYNERMENTIKIVGDLYLARVYSEALERFRVPLWRNSVYRKQRQVAQVYEFLQGEMYTRRSILLETTIVALIVLEIILAFVPGLLH